MAKGTRMRNSIVVPAVAVLAMASAALAIDQPFEAPMLGETMHVERVESGVLRVLRDGAGHDLTDWDTFEDPKPVSSLAAGDDGSMWMTSSGGFIEIDVPGEVADPMDTFLAQMEVGSDGTLWIANGHHDAEIGRWRERSGAVATSRTTRMSRPATSMVCACGPPPPPQRVTFGSSVTTTGSGPRASTSSPRSTDMRAVVATFPATSRRSSHPAAG